MLSTISESIFSRSAHFILELLQNAEDAGARAGTAKGEIEFRISPERIIVVHNGSPFAEADIDAICGVRSTKKPEEGTLGYLGIGFKSVFKVTDCPEVHSGGFHFKFDKNAFTNPSDEPWQITPIWINDVPEAIDTKRTTFVLPFRSDQVFSETLSELERLDVHIFLFLKWMKRLHVINDVTGQSTTIENLGERNRIVSLSKDGSSHRFVIFRRESSVPAQVAEDPALEFYKRQHVKKREVVLAFGVDAQGNLAQIEEASALGSVSSFLPLVEERSGAKFLIQADFLVQPGREAIQYELSWNHWLVEQATEAAKSAVNEFKTHPIWKKQFLSVFDFTEYWGQPAFDRLFRPKLQEPLLNYLNTEQVYPIASGGHVNPERVVEAEEKLQGLIGDTDLPFLFEGRTDLYLADPAVGTKTVPASVQTEVKAATLGEVARNEALLAEKTNQKNYVGWFVKLYTAMAETDDYFKQESGRTSRGRYYTYESPIYVLTDRSSVAPANQVFFHNIPKGVPQLRKQFVDVDALLQSYELIHPRLDSPRLRPFFKEKTHVQSIDYDKICRDVFLPRVTVSASVPLKEELIAYTRLLQKGPPVDDQIWVVTKRGNIKQSNQVFLGTDYSPAEDWEKHARYSPQMDFLSTDYIRGGTHADLLAWKEFFMMTGVRERADNPYVEIFAMAFAEDKLASRLTNFIPKDRQQHGYDREAQRIRGKSVVYLEVKGQKNERAVELDGNEPDAAKQAQQKGQAFWLCVVPNIPENPQLWVVEDVIDAGDFDVLTIDVKQWKSRGRRIS